MSLSDPIVCNDETCSQANSAQLMTTCLNLRLPYSRKYWRGIKFGALVCDRQIKIRQHFILAYIRVAIPYRTAKFKFANISTMAI